MVAYFPFLCSINTFVMHLLQWYLSINQLSLKLLTVSCEKNMLLLGFDLHEVCHPGPFPKDKLLCTFDVCNHGSPTLQLDQGWPRLQHTIRNEIFNFGRAGHLASLALLAKFNLSSTCI